jgi:hypothetical protein
VPTLLDVADELSDVGPPPNPLPHVPSLDDDAWPRRRSPPRLAGAKDFMFLVNTNGRG